MPKILERLVGQLQAKGKDKKTAYAIATASLQRAGDLKAGSQQPTPKGVQRGNMTAGARAKSRAVKQTGGTPSDYVYNRKTNRTRKK